MIKNDTTSSYQCEFTRAFVATIEFSKKIEKN